MILFEFPSGLAHPEVMLHRSKRRGTWNTREKHHGIVRFHRPSFDCEQIERDSFIRDFDAQRYHLSMKDLS